MNADGAISPDEPRVLSAEDRELITDRAIEAAIAVAKKHGVRVGEPDLLANAYSLRLHLLPSPVVARVSLYTPLLRHPIEEWLSREISVTGYLAALGAPVVRPSEDLPPGPHHQDGFTMSFWRYVHPTGPAYNPDPDVAAGMLADLHSALRKYSGELPLLAPPLSDIPRGIARIKIAHLLPAPDVALLEKKYSELLPLLNKVDEKTQPLHGDAHALNLIPTQKGLVWNDFEDACLGPVAWDLASMNDPDNKLLESYPGDFTPEILEPYKQARNLQAVCWVYAMKSEFPEWVDAAKAILDTMRARG